MSDADDAFIRTKSRQVVTWSMLNAAKLHLRPSAVHAGRPLEGLTVFVVGAGYSLTRNGHLLREAQDKGAPILAVNSSDVVLRKAFDITPDVMVIRESLVHDDTVSASEAPLIVADLAVHPDTWRAASDRLAWFIPGFPHFMSLAHRLGVEPVFAGTSALTAAVALAMRWGATRIVLVGVDLAYERVGDVWHGYHPDAPRGDLTAVVHDDEIRQSGNVADDERAVRTGQPTQPKVDRCHYGTPYDWGSPLPTLGTLIDQKAWLETQARRHGLQLVNCSQGVGIAGWRTSDLAQEVAMLEPRTPVVFPAAFPVSEKQVKAVLADVDEGAEQQALFSEELLREDGPRLPHLSRLLTHHAPLPECLAAWELVDAKGEGLQRLTRTCEALRRAAHEARNIVNAVRPE